MYIPQDSSDDFETDTESDNDYVAVSKKPKLEVLQNILLCEPGPSGAFVADKINLISNNNMKKKTVLKK